jgi:hypothetical protein
MCSLTVRQSKMAEPTVNPLKDDARFMGKTNKTSNRNRNDHEIKSAIFVAHSLVTGMKGEHQCIYFPLK